MMTTRRLIIAAPVVAVIAASLMEAGRQLELRRQYASALQDFQASEGYYQDGRVRLENCVERSRRLMKAGLALCRTQTDEITTIHEHVLRIDKLLNEEINFLPVLHDDEFARSIDIWTARESLLQCNVKLDKYAGFVDTWAARKSLLQCNVKLDKLIEIQ